MAFDAHKNFAYSTVATAPSPATSGTSLVVASGDGTKFPAVPFNATIWPALTQPTTANAEIVRVTAISTDTLTITRASESTSARTVIVGDQIAATITAKTLTDIETDLSSADTQVTLQAAKRDAQTQADAGYFCYSGCALTANATAVTAITRTSGNNTFDKTAHGLVANDTITFTGIVNTTGVSNGTVYFVSATGLTANAFRVATTAGGTALTLGGTTDSASITATEVGKLDMAAGGVFVGTTELFVTAQTAISTTVASMADATNPKWVVVELDSSGVVGFNQGTAAATPAFPTLTTTKVPLGFLYVPASATNVDTLLTTLNGLAKLIDARNVRSVHIARQVANDPLGTSAGAGTALTNPTSLTSILTNTIVLPANSIQAGDVFILDGTMRYVNSQNASTIEIKLIWGSFTAFDWTTVSLSTSASARSIPFRYTAIAAGTGIMEGGGRISVGAAAAIGALGADADTGNFQTAGFSLFNASTTIDLQVKVTTSSSTSTFALRGLTLVKFPA